nr:unnamed protein product [Callosobruchus analis]
MDSDLNNVLSQLAAGMVGLQKSFEGLSLLVRESGDRKEKEAPIVNKVDHSYIYIWKELGGNQVVFGPGGKTHPQAFIKKLKKLFLEAGVPEDQKIGLAISCLRGTAADWAAIKENCLTSFEDFETAFINRYWGIDKQRDLYSNLCYGRYENGSRADYFLNLINQAGYLTESLPEAKLISMVSRHFPAEIQRGIAILGLKTFDEVEEYLRNIDEAGPEVRMSSGGAGWRTGGSRETMGGVERLDGGIGNVRNIMSHKIPVFCEDLDLVSSDAESDVGEEIKFQSPILRGKIGCVSMDIVVDSGSEVSAISENLFNKMKEHMRIPTLPVSGLAISPAFGAKRQRIRLQALLPIKSLSDQDVDIDVKCLVIPGLNCDVLFGCDWLSYFKAGIDFCKSTISFWDDDKNYIVSFNSEINDQAEISIQGDSTVSFHQYSDNEIKAVVDKSETDESTRCRLENLLVRYRDVFSENPGCVKSYVHRVEMEDDSPFNAPMYPIPFCYREEVRKQVVEMERWGVVTKQRTNYISPLVVVKKRDSTPRICIDARILNSRMRKDFIPPPNPAELLLSFKKGVILSTIDLTASYWQIRIHEQDRKYVGFIYEGETYVFRKLPFGLSTSMASLIRCLNQVLGAACQSFTMIYVDDLLVFSDNIDQHLEHLGILFDKLLAEGITVKLRKCQFLRQQVVFLGHIISSEGVRMDPDRIESIVKFPAPRNVKELRAFLGLVNYDKRFCDKYSELTVPLVRLLRKREIWCWDEEQKNGFANIKQAYLNVTLMVHPDFKKEFFVQCDSSDYAIGGRLFQKSNADEQEVIAYTSRTLKGSQLRYTTTEKEMFALLSCLEQWRSMLLGRNITVLTDHKALTFFLTCKLRSARLSRWILYIQEFSFKIEHCPGAQNRVADTLSRFPANKDIGLSPERSVDITIMLVRVTDTFRQLCSNFEKWREDQLKDSWIADKLVFLEGLVLSVPVWSEKEYQMYRWYVIHEGLLFKRGDFLCPGYKLCVPRSRVLNLIRMEHEQSGHFGKTKVLARMKEYFYWPKMQKHIRQFVAACDMCQKAKPSRVSRGLLHSVVPKMPGELVCLDLIGPLPASRGGTTQLLVLVDAFSKFVKLYALKRATTRSILNKVLGDYIPKVQKPQCLLSDNGTQFSSKKWSEALGEIGIQAKFISVYFPEGNITERYNREVGRLLRMYCHEKHSRWAYVLDFVEECLNTAISDSTGYSPRYLHSGETVEHPVTRFINFPVETTVKPSLQQLWMLAHDRMSKNAKRRAIKHSGKITPIEFREGDKVLVRTHMQSCAEDKTIKKFFYLYTGPYWILRKAGPNCYILRDGEGKELPKQNIINLKGYKDLPPGFPM